MISFRENFDEAQAVLVKFMNDENNFVKMEKAGQIMVASIQNGGKIIACGNGGSMSDAMHFVEELTGRFRDERPSIPAIAISDPTHISCVANDYGYDHIFSRFIEAMGHPNDVLLSISTSGNSPNVVNAVIKAREKGLKIISLTGKSGGKLASLSDVEIRVPHDGYSDRIQEIHIKVIHSFIHYIEQNLA